MDAGPIGSVQGWGGGGANFNAMTCGSAYNRPRRREGFAAQTVEPGAQYMTDIGLSVLPKDVTRLLITVTIKGEVHSFPVSVVTRWAAGWCDWERSWFRP